MKDYTQEYNNARVKDHSYDITPEVEAMGEIPFTGNIVPNHWYQALTFENGRPYFVAVTLLSDIVYWYRPVQERSESNGQVIGVRKKFKADFLQRQTKSYATQFGFSEKQVKDALRFLEEKGYIQRHFRDVNLGMETGVLSNRQYIELIPEAIDRLQKSLTYRPAGPDPQIPTSLGEDPQVLYTKTTSESSKKSSKKNNNPAPPEEPKKPPKKKNAPKAAPSSVVVFSCLDKLELKDPLKKRISKDYSEEQVKLAVKRTLRWKGRTSDSSAIMSALKNPDTWEDKLSKEDMIEENRQYLNSIKHLDDRHIGLTVVGVTNRYVEFVTGSKSEVFEVDDNKKYKEFRRLVEYRLEKAYEHARSV